MIYDIRILKYCSFDSNVSNTNVMFQVCWNKKRHIHVQKSLKKHISDTLCTLPRHYIFIYFIPVERLNFLFEIP